MKEKLYDKISSGIKGYKTKQIIKKLGIIYFPKIPSLCLCGCNEIVWNGKEYKKGHKLIDRKAKLSDGSWYPKIFSICQCDDINCRKFVYDGNEFIHGHQNRGKISSNETKKKLKISHTKLFLIDENGNKLIYPPIPDICHCKQPDCNEIVYGGREYIEGHHNLIMDMSGDKNPFKNKHHTLISIEKIRESHRRENLSPETIEKMRISNSGRKHTETWKKQQSIRNSGEGNPCYIDGRSKLPYCEKWTSKLRESVRIRDSYTCQLCGKTQEEEIKTRCKKLSAHHIHYDKKNCYPDLICLCNSCNTKVNKINMRKYYESLFMNKLNDRNLLFWTRRMII